MGLLIGILKIILKLLIYFTIFVSIVILIPNFPPYTKFTDIKLAQTQPRVGNLSPNEALNNAEKLFSDKLIGPEAFRIYNDELYTGLATGEIVKISPGGHITFVTKIGQPCAGLYQEHICGRPLGFEIDEKNKLLYVVDAYHGIWKVDLKTDRKQLLVSPDEKINRRQPKIFNGIALDKNGNLYWTHSSSDFDLKDGVMTTLADPSGRLLYYNSANNQSKVLLDNLWFSNGVVISADNQFVLVAESNHYRIMKYYINGPKKDKSEVFAAGLPGIPDNLQVLPDGSGILIGLYVVFDDENPLISQSLAGTSLARKFLARLSRLIEIHFEFINEQYPHVILQEIIYKIGHFSSLSSIMPQISGILQLDWNGNIVASYFNTDKSIGTISDAIVYNNKLYIGSPHSPYIASVEVPPLLKKAFTKAQAAREVPIKKEEVKKSPQVESASTAKVVNNEEKETLKVAEMKDIPKVDKPSVQNTQTPRSPPQESSEKTPSKKSPQSNTEAQALNNQETKPIKQETETKPKPVETKPIRQESEAKPKPIETKSIRQDTATKPKLVETKPIRQETDTKSKLVDETKPNGLDTKTKPKLVEIKSSKQKSETKPKPVETKPIQQDSETKLKLTDTGTKREIDPKLAMIKENINVKKTEETSKVDQEKVDRRQKQSKDSNEKDVRQNIEPVNLPNVNKPKVENIKTPTEKPKLKKNKNENKDTIKTKPSNEQQKPVPDQIPVTEFIPSDRVKPPKETLKVIKKSGPIEIPNPN